NPNLAETRNSDGFESPHSALKSSPATPHTRPPEPYPKTRESGCVKPPCLLSPRGAQFSPPPAASPPSALGPLRRKSIDPPLWDSTNPPAPPAKSPPEPLDIRLLSKEPSPPEFASISHPGNPS